MAIAKESWKYRDGDWEKARNILDEGLKNYPDNDILLLHRLYGMNYDDTPDEVISVALKIIDVSKDEATKYDACQFLAYAYKAKNDLESARKAIDLIPDIRFSNQRLKASILEGNEKWDAACQEYSESLYSFMFITYSIAECHVERGEYEKALESYEDALRVLDVLKVKEGWYNFREGFNENIAEIKEKLKNSDG